jgi:ABC-type multidrug transport system fused ATPase/permease subunit
MKDTSSKHRLLRRILRHVPQRRRREGIAVLGLMLVGACAELLTIGAILPLLTLLADPEAAEKHRMLRELRDVMNLSGDRESLTVFGAIFCAVAVGAAAVRIILAWATKRFVFRIGYDLGISLYTRMLYQPYEFHVSSNSSRILSSLSNIQKLLTGMLQPLMQGITAVIIATFILAALLLINAPVALAAIASFAAIYIGVSLATRARLSRISKTVAQTSQLRIQAAREALGGIRDVLLDGSQPLHISKFAAIDRELRDAQASATMISVTPRFVVEGLGMVMIVILALVLHSTGDGLASTLPILGALAIGAQRMLPLLQQTFAGWASIMANRAIFVQIIELLEHHLPEDVDTRHETTKLPFDQNLVLDRISFFYDPGGREVLSDISLHVEKGSRIGFVGKTGSGKSTLMDLIMGLLSPTSGEIRVDGAVLRGPNVVSWQRQVAHVPQHIFLADASLLANVAFGTPPESIDRERVADACRRADIHEFIISQPEGYDTRAGERGVKLSGGQRQRIGIARALYKQSSVLILDEATSALDDATEAEVMRAVERLGRDLTIFIIAHRITTLKGCDRICRLEQGSLVASGSYEDLIEGAVAELPQRPTSRTPDDRVA